MLRLTLYTLFLLSSLVFSASCDAGQNSPTPAPNLPNPASVYCEQNGGKLELRQDSAGGVAGACVFSDGSECDEWAYFRGECKRGDRQPAPGPTSSPAATRPAPEPTDSHAATSPAPAASAEFASDGCRIYRNRELGYSLHYPPDATISHADDPERTLTVTGPLSGNDHWPVIFFSHPSDREDYRPPEGVDLEKWLTEHNLLMTGGKQGEARQPDAEIARTKAVHTRLARSPQTYAYDKYYFARSQQLYVVVILHTGDKQDWTLYNHFLASIRFETS
ncbi:MAG: DUF333 domain-containing protein [Anaerolineae bacterium]